MKKLLFILLFFCNPVFCQEDISLKKEKLFLERLKNTPINAFNDPLVRTPKEPGKSASFLLEHLTDFG